MIRAALAALLFAPAVAAAGPPCWPSNIPGAGGTPMRDAELIAPPGVTGPTIDAIYWYCPDATMPAGWVDVYVWCERAKRSECLGRVTLFAASALTSLWDASKPKSLAAAGYAWAEDQLHNLHLSPNRPPAPVAEVWVVAKAPTNASPPGTRPSYHWRVDPAQCLAGMTLAQCLVDSQQRIGEGTACDATKPRFSSGTTNYLAVAAAPNLLAVCVRK